MNGLFSAFSKMAGGLSGELEECAENSRWEDVCDAMTRLRTVVAASSGRPTA